MPQTKTKPFDWQRLIERVLLAIAISVAAYFGLPVPTMMGCVRPGPVVVVPDPPNPVVQSLKKIIVCRESGKQSPALALIVTSLQGGKGERWLAEKGITLAGIVDPGDIDYTNAADKLVEKWKTEIGDGAGEIVLLLDENDRLIRKEPIPVDVTLDTFIALCTEHTEQSFASNTYVDTDFTQWPQFTDGDNAEIDTFEENLGEPILKSGEPVLGQASPRGPPATGLIPENPAEGEPIFEDAIPLIPREQWPTAIKAIDDNGGSLDLLVVEIKDQGQEGACVSDATVQSMQLAQAIRRGKKGVIKLSAISLYKQVGRTAGGGSMVSDNLRAATGVGVLPLTSPDNSALFPHTMPNTGFHRSYPDGWKDTAKRFRVNEVYDVRSFDGFITALLRGYPVVYGRSGHSICAVRPVYKNGRLYVKYANSWTPQWGENGYGYDSESMIRAGASWAFAVRTVVDPGLAELPRPMVEANQSVEYALAP